ncbi:DNA-3-methyladenine glycosylase 2 [Enterobacter roggenkampii]|uniref:DNA-3-methyladenine glycosylase 2 n=1 Tax=Enterobacter roggenkampii TaxID=1812935 RepID=UPI000BA898A6|nr:DNA-3-methyladenine glycosylase 2 [Enterobacter roggenkampii]PAO13346.1 DNA-3-methyladenine glycosylase 2 [Enterobacter roggenkampii]WFC76953.1 DNA-3-methyladenine glycosylase 2 [Enterobacter roggenkampii]HDR2875054.1 DNA-3-methyladenine glycosylase 2 [Enterobacter roggenkampii]
MYTLTWLPPYDWQWMFGFLGARAVTGIETVTNDYYERSFACEGHQGIFRVTPDIASHTLSVTLSPGLIPVAQACLERIERLFDLRCNPQQIAETLGELGAARPGLRLPGAMDAYEQGVRAILGQLVSVAMAAKLASRVVALCGEPVADCPGYLCFPTPQALAAADPLALKALGMPLKRAESLIHLAQSVIDGTFPLSPPANTEEGMKALQQRPGIGRWTANYLALRGWQAKDVFLPDDYLIKQRFAGMTPAQIRRYAERWKPWRSYALLHIWYTDGWAPSVDGKIAGVEQKI